MSPAFGSSKEPKLLLEPLAWRYNTKVFLEQFRFCNFRPFLIVSRRSGYALLNCTLSLK